MLLNDQADQAMFVRLSAPLDDLSYAPSKVAGADYRRLCDAGGLWHNPAGWRLLSCIELGKEEKHWTRLLPAVGDDVVFPDARAGWPHEWTQ